MLASACTEPRNFRWGPHSGEEFFTIVSGAYEEVIHGKRNVFLVPSGSASKVFIAELARLFQAYADCSSLESVAIKAITVAQAFLLQKPSHNSKRRDHISHLQRRLKLWENGDIQSLIGEGCCIQKHLCKTPGHSGDEAIACTFSKLMLEGEVQSSLRYLSRNTSGGVLKLDKLIPV